MRRKDINVFLESLDRFLETNKDVDILKYIFIPIFRVTKSSVSISKTKPIDIPTLVSLVNKYSPYNKSASKQRTDFFVRKVAYSIKFKEVYDFSYEEIFKKILVKEGVIDATSIISNHGKDVTKLEKLMIPIDWYHDNSFYIYT